MKSLFSFDYYYVLPLFFIIFGCAFGNRLEEKFEQSYPLERNGSLSLTNLNGSITITSHAQAEVKIMATKTVRAASHQEAERLMEQLKIEITRGPDFIEIETEYPRQRRSHSSFWNLFTSNRPGQFSVSYEIVVPEQVKLNLRTTNGHVHVENVSGELIVRTTNGGLKLIDVDGSISAKTTNGSIESTISKFDAANELDLVTTNGKIKIELPDAVDATVYARTTNGRISTDFPLQTTGHYSSRRIEGTIGAGNGKIELRTTNGSISIQKR